MNIEKLYQHLDAVLDEVSNIKTLLGCYEAEAESRQEKIQGGFDSLAVTTVNVYPFKEGPSLGHLKGLASIELNGQFLVRGLRILDGENGLFVGYPNDPFYKGEEFRFICQPITRQIREEIENKVLEKYQEAVNG